MYQYNQKKSIPRPQILLQKIPLIFRHFDAGKHLILPKKDKRSGILMRKSSNNQLNTPDP